MGDRKGTRNGRAKLTETQVLEIIQLLGHMRLALLAAKYRVSKSAIKDIRSGKSWGHLTHRVYAPMPKREAK